MPIKAENKNRYPKNWPEIREKIRMRANDKCETCGVVNHSRINKLTREICLSDEEDAIRVVCTVAHLDHTPENCGEENLKLLCQRCHNRYDIKHRKETRLNTRMKDQMQLNFNIGIFNDDPFLMTITFSSGEMIKITKY
jgi:5-methylcytosine-specific restriction endonuclease McrA